MKTVRNRTQSGVKWRRATEATPLFPLCARHTTWGPPFWASDTELTLDSARFRAVSQSYVPDPGAPPGNRACWGIMKNDEVSFFHIIPRTCFWVLLYWARMCKRKGKHETHAIPSSAHAHPPQQSKTRSAEITPPLGTLKIGIRGSRTSRFHPFFQAFRDNMKK